MPQVIVIEGPEGAGKTTLVKNLPLALSPEVALSVRLPGTSRLGEMIRGMMETKDLPICRTAQWGLFFADRAQALTDLRERAMDADYWIFDRMHLSTLVYQVLLGDIPRALAEEGEAVLLRMMPSKPLTILLNARFDTLCARVDRRNDGRGGQRFKTPEARRKQYEAYQLAAADLGDKIRIIDTEGKTEIEVLHEAVTIITEAP